MSGLEPNVWCIAPACMPMAAYVVTLCASIPRGGRASVHLPEDQTLHAQKRSWQRLSSTEKKRQPLSHAIGNRCLALECTSCGLQVCVWCCRCHGGSCMTAATLCADAKPAAATDMRNQLRAGRCIMEPLDLALPFGSAAFDAEVGIEKLMSWWGPRTASKTKASAWQGSPGEQSHSNAAPWSCSGICRRSP